MTQYSQVRVVMVSFDGRILCKSEMVDFYAKVTYQSDNNGNESYVHINLAIVILSWEWSEDLGDN